MDLQQMADDLGYKRDLCEQCHGRGFLPPRGDTNAPDGRTGPSPCTCERGYLWYPKQDPNVPRPLGVGITGFRLIQLMQQREASQRS
jgi:hypothetical protein